MQAAVLHDQHRPYADRSILAGRRHQRFHAFAAPVGGRIGRRAVDGVFDTRRGLRVDQRRVAAGDQELDLQAERLGEGVVEFGKPGDRIAGAGLGDDAHPERADLVAPVRLTLARPASSGTPRQCRAPRPRIPAVSGSGGRAALPNCQCPWQTLCLAHPSGNRSQHLSHVACVPVRPRFLRRRRSRGCGALSATPARTRSDISMKPARPARPIARDCGRARSTFPT